jgi:hypothetical protein
VVNGVDETFVERTTGDLIRHVDSATPPKSCEFGRTVQPALIAALRMAESAYKRVGRLCLLLTVGFAVTAKVDGIGIPELLKRMFEGFFR